MKSASTRMNTRKNSTANTITNKDVALITGATGGIGSALCTIFRSEGYEVVATDIKNGHCDADHFIQLDVRNLYGKKKARESFCMKMEKICKGRGLKVLINNAATQILNHADDIRIADWDKTLQTNLIAPFLLIQSMLPMLEQARGSVVNIASIHAAVTKPEFICYATSKAALVGLTRSLAVDLGPRVRINAISPAATDTPMLRSGFKNVSKQIKNLSSMHPLERIAQPEEIARTAMFLASDNANFITGVNLAVDGGIGGRLHDPV